MEKFFSLIFLLFFVFSVSFAQKPEPTSAPTPKEEVVRISTDLIQVDVTVTDKDGKILIGLKPEDFEIFENGEKQPITNFSFISKITTPTGTTTPKINANADPKSSFIPPAQIKPEQVRRTIALVVDDFSLSSESIITVRKSLKKFVDEQMLPDDLVAVIQIGKGVGALQQFTSDKRLLYAAIESVKWNPLGRGQSSAIKAIEPNLNAIAQVPRAGDDDSNKGLRDPDQLSQQYRDSVLTTMSLDAINYVVRGMKALPGRKSIMLLSDGMKVINRQAVGKEGDLRVMSYMQKLIDSATRASVVFYTVDVRGLETLGITAADNTMGYSVKEDNTLQKEQNKRKEDFSDNQEGLVMLAQETGGKAYLYNNNVNHSLEQALADQKGYYLIGYQPDTETFNAQTRRFNKLEIKVNRADASVRYRSGFFSVEETDNQAAKSTPQQQITNALTSPFSTNQINIRFNALFGNEASTGGYVRSLLHINAQDLKFSDEPNGDKKATFDVVAASFGENGIIADQIRKNYTITTKAKDYENLLRDGVVYNFVFPIKKSGAYQIRVAVRDAATGNIGSANQFIEIPNLKKDKLVLSGIILESLTEAQWQQVSQPSAPAVEKTDPITDTSLRRFKRGTILRYAVEIYNAKADGKQTPSIISQINLFNNGQLVLAGRQVPVDVSKQTDPRKVNLIGALNLSNSIPPGDYVLQILITDNSDGGKGKTTTQFVELEIVK